MFIKIGTILLALTIIFEIEAGTQLLYSPGKIIRSNKIGTYTAPSREKDSPKKDQDKFASSSDKNKATLNSDNINYIQKAARSSVDMLIRATKKYKEGAITKEQFIEISMQVAALNDYASMSEGVTSTEHGKLSSNTPSPTANSNTIEKYPGSVPAIYTPSSDGAATDITCPDYKKYTLFFPLKYENGVTNPKEAICILRRHEDTVIEKTAFAKCPAGYYQRYNNGKHYCEPIIQQIADGTYICPEGSYEPTKNANGEWDCVGSNGKLYPNSKTEVRGSAGDCKEETQKSVSCAQYAGQYGIPSSDKFGEAVWTKNNCTGIIKYLGGCSREQCSDNHQTPVNCADYAGTYGIPADHKTGFANWTKNSCTGKIRYLGGCR